VRSSLQASGMTRNAAYDEKVMERMHASGASAASSSTDDIAFLDEHKDTATLINEIRSRFTSVRDGQSLDGWTRRHDPFRERLRAREGLDALDRKFAKMAPPKPPTPPTAVDAPDAAIAADAVRGASSTAAPSGKATCLQSEPTLSRTEETGGHKEKTIYNTVHRSATARQGTAHGTARQGTSRKAASRASPPVRHTNRTMLFDEKLAPSARMTGRGHRSAPGPAPAGMAAPTRSAAPRFKGGPTWLQRGRDLGRDLGDPRARAVPGRFALAWVKARPVSVT